MTLKSYLSLILSYGQHAIKINTNRKKNKVNKKHTHPTLIVFYRHYLSPFEEDMSVRDFLQDPMYVPMNLGT